MLNKIKFILKIIACLIVLMAFWSILFTGSSFSIFQSIGQANIGQTNILGNISENMSQMSINSTKPLTYPIDRTVVLRMDDVQGYYMNNIVINLTDTALRNDISMTLGVIPESSIDSDAIIKNYLIDKSNNPRIEIAQHGYNHQEHFDQYDEKEAYRLINLGRNDIINILKVYPVTFIPPYNEYNNNTIKALLKFNFKILSAEKYEYDLNRGIRIIGYTTLTKYSDQNDLIPTDNILNECNESLNQKNICVVMIHPQDYASEDGVGMNQTRYDEYIKLLNGIKNLNAKSATFRDLLK